MQKYGMLVDENLLLSSRQLEGYKPVEYAEIPDFDQSTHYAIQEDPVDEGESIFVGAEIRELENIDEGEGFDEDNMAEFN